MLRGRPNPTANETDSTSHGGAAGAVSYPAGDVAYLTADKPVGIRFYRARESFFYPYALLQGMRFSQQKLTVSFATADVAITGEGLHELYVRIADQEVSGVVEQHARGQAVSDGAVFVARIEETIR
jgi:hypothetical protein